MFFIWWFLNKFSLIHLEEKHIEILFLTDKIDPSVSACITHPRVMVLYCPYIQGSWWKRRENTDYESPVKSYKSPYYIMKSFLNSSSLGNTCWLRVLFWERVCMLCHFSCVWLFATLWTTARQAPLSVGFSRQEYWNGLSCHPPGGHLHLGMESTSHVSCIGRWGLHP